MAAPTESKVIVGTGGKLYRAPAGTALPADASTALSGDFIAQGYVSSDGFKRAIDKAFSAIRDWTGEEIAKARTELSVSAAFNLASPLDADSLKSVWGEDAVTVTAADATHGERIAVAYAGDELPRSVWVADLAYNGRLMRMVFPNCQNTTESFEQEFTNESIPALPVELTVYKDGSGKFFYDYTNDGVPTA